MISIYNYNFTFFYINTKLKKKKKYSKKYISECNFKFYKYTINHQNQSIDTNYHPEFTITKLQ